MKRETEHESEEECWYGSLYGDIHAVMGIRQQKEKKEDEERKTQVKKEE